MALAEEDLEILRGEVDMVVRKVDEHAVLGHGPSLWEAELEAVSLGRSRPHAIFCAVITE
jgi:hypothetical protein